MAKPKRASAAVRVDPKDAGKAKPRPKLWRRILLWGLVSLVSLGLVGTGAVVYAYATIKIPDVNADFKTNTTFVYYGDGKTQLGSYQVQNRVTIDYSAMPQNVKDAIVAAENRTFWTDPGISVTGLARAALGLVGISSPDNTATGGGSTITQQYIKLMYLNQERSFSRKATELLLAAKMGQELSKDQILADYLNTVYFGRGAYGIQAASQAYFKKDAAKLTLAEAVAVAAIVNSPGNLDPAAGTTQAADLLQRYQYTLNGLVEMGKITEAQKDKIYYKLPKFQPVNNDSRLGGQKGFLLSVVRTELLAKGFTDQQISGGGYKVITTFDDTDQQAAVKAAQDKTLQTVRGDKKKAKSLHAAIVSIDNATGGVLAMYGGPDYVKSQWNWATTPRQTGSSFKPYALAAALNEGWTLSDRVSGSTIVTPGGTRITNPEGNLGPITLQYATTHSINTAFYDLVSRMDGGAQAVETMANDCGVPTGDGWYLDARMPLGNPEISPLNQASGYSTFANYGLHRDAHVVAQVLDSNGKVVYQAKTDGSQTVEQDVAQDVTYALTQVTRDGTGRAASYLGYPVAGKTGTKGQPTKNGGRETVAAWFVGYTVQVTTAVMYVAGADGNHPLENYSPSFYGGGIPAQTWVAYMKTAMSGMDAEPFLGKTDRQSTQTSKAAKPKPSAPSSSPGQASASPSLPPSEPATSQAPQTSAPATSEAPVVTPDPTKAATEPAESKPSASSSP